MSATPASAPRSTAGRCRCDTSCKNGDQVEIILSDAQTPPAAWESVVVTGKARSAIRRATKEAVRKQYMALGRDIVKAAFERMGKTYSDSALAAILPKLGQKCVEDLLTAVGRGETTAGEVIRRRRSGCRQGGPAQAAHHHAHR